MRILIVDDYESCLQVLKAYLSLLGHCPITAKNGVEGMHCIENEIPDVILSDVNMPVMDGITFLQKARVQLPHIPFIMMSGYEGFSMRDAAQSHGAHAFLKKTIDPENLRDILQKMMQEKGTEERIYPLEKGDGYCSTYSNSRSRHRDAPRWDSSGICRGGRHPDKDFHFHTSESLAQTAGEFGLVELFN